MKLLLLSLLFASCTTRLYVQKVELTIQGNKATVKPLQESSVMKDTVIIGYKIYRK